MRIIAAIVLVAVLAVGGGIVATTAYQAGVNTAVTQAAADGATVVNPVVVPAYGYGWHPFGFGFGFFGFLFTLFFLFIVFGLIRAIIWGGRGHRHGWGGPGWGGSGWDPDARRDHDASKFHGRFDDWHRQAHDAPAGPTTNPPTTNPPTSTPPAG
jgi:hypothetical protein